MKCQYCGSYTGRLARLRFFSTREYKDKEGIIHIVEIPHTSIFVCDACKQNVGEYGRSSEQISPAEGEVEALKQPTMTEEEVIEGFKKLKELKWI
jgi:hypothetical protein